MNNNIAKKNTALTKLFREENEVIYTDIGEDIVKLPNDMRIINENLILLISTIFDKLKNKSPQSCIYSW